MEHDAFAGDGTWHADAKTRDRLVGKAALRNPVLDALDQRGKLVRRGEGGLKHTASKQIGYDQQGFAPGDRNPDSIGGVRVESEHPGGPPSPLSCCAFAQINNHGLFQKVLYDQRNGGFAQRKLPCDLGAGNRLTFLNHVKHKRPVDSFDKFYCGDSLISGHDALLNKSCQLNNTNYGLNIQ